MVVVTNVVKNNNSMSFRIEHSHSNETAKIINFKSFSCEVKLTALKNNNNTHKYSFYVKTYKKSGENDNFYNFLCRINQDDTMQFSCDKNWKFIDDLMMYSGGTNNNSYGYPSTPLSTMKHEVSIEVILNKHINYTFFKTVHDDIPADFELRGTGGSVQFHRLVLAGSSPVFMTMLSGQWKEAAEDGTTVQFAKQTLESFKKLLYFRELPENGLEELLLLVSYYMIDDLQELCIDYLMFSMKPEDVPSMIELAGQNNIVKLTLALFDQAECGEINMAKVRKHMIKKNDNNANKTLNDDPKKKRTKKK